MASPRQGLKGLTEKLGTSLATVLLGALVQLSRHPRNVAR
jgi:hypothetical protein